MKSRKGDAGARTKTDEPVAVGLLEQEAPGGAAELRLEEEATATRHTGAGPGACVFSSAPAACITSMP